MSKYAAEPLSFEGLKTVPIAERGGKVMVDHFARPYQKGDGVARLLGSLPKLLAADVFRGVIEALQRAKAQKRAILWGLGGHVVKCGLADVMVDLMRRGWVTGFVMNGAASITISKSPSRAKPARTWTPCCRTAALARRKKPAAK